jgi:hypothetical protein
MVEKIELKIRTLVNHFRRRPLNYFTESDIHSYLYLAFYRDKLFSGQYPTLNPVEKTVLVHREYPTFFKYDNQPPIVPSDKARSRGHYDLVILNPEFVKANRLDVVTNKEYSFMLKKPVIIPLIAAIEFKFIIGQINEHMLKNIKLDFQKLTHTKPYSYSRYFLLFNRFGPIGENFGELERMREDNVDVKAVYAEAFYEGNEKKHKEIYWFD